MNIDITIVVEDSLSEAVARKLLQQSDVNYNVTNCLGGKGFGYLKNKINDFNKAAKTLPLFVLTDQDSGCPPSKIKKWFKRQPHPNLIFRIAVMEIESWIMADRFAIAQYLSISVDNFPKKMDEINDPKKFLLDIVKKSRSRKLKEDLIPASGSTAKIGPNYNARLSNFVRNDWDVHEAIKHSESLNRSFKYIQNFQNPR